LTDPSRDRTIRIHTHGLSWPSGCKWSYFLVVKTENVRWANITRRKYAKRLRSALQTCKIMVLRLSSTLETCIKVHLFP
jgi:hypothetical protein